MGGHRESTGSFWRGNIGAKRQTGSRERVTSTLSIYCHIGFSLCLYLYFFVIDCSFLVLYHLDIYLQMSPIENKKIRKINHRVIVIESIISIGILVCNKHSRLVNPLLSWSFVINTWCNFFTDLIECASRDSVSAFSFVYCRWPVDRLTEVSVFRSPTFPVREINHPHAVICDFYSYKLF